MSSYITRYCESHGEWDQDVDDPYEECPECVEKGIAPSQLEKLEKDALKQEIESLREQLAATDEYKQELRKANNEFGSETECWPDLWRRISELKRIHGQEYRDRLEAEKEIESLRTALESACNERDLAQDKRDEWMLRAWELYQLCPRSQDVDKWFEEEHEPSKISTGGE